MTNKELAEMLGVKPQQIADKVRSTNKMTAIMIRMLLEMPRSMAEPFATEAKEKFALVEDEVDARREREALRAKAKFEGK